MSEVYEDPIFNMDNAVLQLMESQQNDQTLAIVKRIPIINAFLVNISFSPDG